jgi:hypothetical protein
LFFPAAIPNLARLIFCTSTKEQKPVQKTEQNHPQQNPALPDFVGQNTAREGMTYEMPGIGNVFGERIIVMVWMAGNMVRFYAERIESQSTLHTFANPRANAQTKACKRAAILLRHPCQIVIFEL